MQMPDILLMPLWLVWADVKMQLNEAIKKPIKVKV